MKDAKEALYCMGQMADKCLTSLGAIHKDYNEFASLVKRMRDAQKERNSLSSKITFLTEEDIRIRANSIRKTMSLESEVDEWLEELE